jgi:hypothetical protein
MSAETISVSTAHTPGRSASSPRVLLAVRRPLPVAYYRDAAYLILLSLLSENMFSATRLAEVSDAPMRPTKSPPTATATRGPRPAFSRRAERGQAPHSHQRARRAYISNEHTLPSRSMRALLWARARAARDGPKRYGSVGPRTVPTAKSRLASEPILSANA